MGGAVLRHRRDLTSVIFLDAAHGWVAGTTGSGLTGARAVLLGTSDGGATWQTLNVGDKGTDFRGLTFTDALHGWAVARYVRDELCVVTRDGGKTWQTQEVLARGWLQAIDSISSGRACAVGAAGAVYLSDSP